MSNEPSYGGCQCGAIRSRADALCHCRMCQKAGGGFFAALVGAPLTAREPAIFASSEYLARGFLQVA